MELFSTLLACAGLVFILRYSEVLARPRAWLVGRSDWAARLLGCSLCLGFWVGWLPLVDGWLRRGALDVDLRWPFCVAAFCWFADGLLETLHRGER